MTTTYVDCPECNGSGEVRHPRWGLRSCPEPYVDCPVCYAEGKVEAEEADQ